MEPNVRRRVEALLGRVQSRYPDLHVDSVTRLHGQFNDVLIVSGEWVFRFPRSGYASEMLQSEWKVLRAVRPHLSLPVPNPELGDLNALEPFVGYRLIPGAPLHREQLSTEADSETVQLLADQLASFLKELHTIPLDLLGDEIPRRDRREQWVEMYAALQQQLFPLMREDARVQIQQHFECYLAEDDRFGFEAVVRHGDFGAGNILWDPQTGRVTGVIDFSFAGIGDPAIDAAAISTLGEGFLERMFGVYPELAGMLDRVRFYRGTYALKEALDGLRDGDAGAFERGMRNYR